jgi:ribosomal protein S18 acetylase RimI-like enzyme
MTTLQAPEVTLDPMTEPEFEAWLPPAVRGLAQSHAESGRWDVKDALNVAKAEFSALLANGLETPGQHLLTIRDKAAGETVGYVWIGVRPKGRQTEAWIQDFVVLERHRGRGYGRAAMLAAFAAARGLGADCVGLHVFGHNAAARALYGSLGFVETNIMMSLPLPPAGD